MGWHRVAKVGEVDDEEVVGVDAGGQEVAIYNLGGVFYATHNICTHQFARLSDGYVEDGCIECPLHQGTFDIATGEARNPPVTENLRTFPVKIEGDDIFVDIDGGSDE